MQGSSCNLQYMFHNISLGRTFYWFDLQSLLETANGFELKLDTGLTSEFNMSINVDSMEYFLYVNLLAIFLLIVLNDIYKEKVSDKLNKKDDSISESTLTEESENTTP